MNAYELHCPTYGDALVACERMYGLDAFHRAVITLESSVMVLKDGMEVIEDEWIVRPVQSWSVGASK